MNTKFTINELVVKVPGNKLPKVLDLSALDDHTRNAILKAYNDSVIYAPNITATKSEKISAAMANNIAEFRSILSEIPNPSGSDISGTFCQTFDFDSVTTPNIVRIIQSLASYTFYNIDMDALLGILSLEHDISITPAELYAEFQEWKYYQMIKACVGGVSVVKFMRFYLGLIKSI